MPCSQAEKNQHFLHLLIQMANEMTILPTKRISSQTIHIDHTWQAFEFEGAVRNSLGEMK